MVNTIAHKATLVNLSTSAWGIHRSNSEATEEVLTKHNAEKNTGKFSKRLISKKATAGIRTVKNAARAFHLKMTLPWFDDGTGALPNVSHMEYTSKMHEFKNLYDAAVDAFIKEYPSHVKDAKRALGSLYDDKDYPSAAEVRKKYKLSVVFLPWPDKEDFRCTLDEGLMREIGDNLDTRLEEILKTGTANIAERITDVIGHMSKRLKAYKPGDPGKGRKAEGKFHDTLVEHVRELADLLPGFNLTDNPKLTSITNTIKTKLAIHDPDVLRDVEKIRKQVIKDSDLVLKQIKEFMS